MRVEELIKVLQDYPKDAEILIPNDNAMFKDDVSYRPAYRVFKDEINSFVFIKID